MFSFFKKKESFPLKTLGQVGELVAQEEYKKRGFKIIAANFFNQTGLRKGEIDFVAKDKNHLVFVEVKTRSEDVGLFGTAAESVNQFKQTKLLKAVKLFFQQYPEYIELEPRIDVCVVIMHEVDNPAKSVTIISNAVEDFS